MDVISTADNSIEGLKQRILLRKPLEAFDCYQKLKQEGNAYTESRLTFRIGAPLLKYIEILYKEIKKYKNDKIHKSTNVLNIGI